MELLNVRYYKLAMSIILSLFPLITIGNCGAASIRHVSIDDISLGSQLIFEGEVLSVLTERNSSGRIHTYITFAIKDKIKGEYSNSTITLSFAGGSIDGESMSVSDMVYPALKERGIYFVESLERAQINPFYGWSQGHFILQHYNGTDIVLTNKNIPVTGFTDSKYSTSTSIKRRGGDALSDGVSVTNGLIMGKTDERKNCIAAGVFKEHLREQLKLYQ